MTLQHFETGSGTPLQPLRRAPMQRRSVERVQRMLDAAQQLVAEVGYDALTTTLIAERADVSIGSLYQFFPDKQAVVRAVALRNLERFTERLTDLAGSKEHTTWWDLTNAVLDAYVAMHHDIPGFQTIRFGDVADLHLLDPVRDNDSVVAERFVKLIRPTVDVAEDVDLELDMVIAVKIADVLTRYAFERDPNGDRAVLSEAKRLVRAHLARRFGEPTVSDTPSEPEASSDSPESNASESPVA